MITDEEMTRVQAISGVDIKFALLAFHKATITRNLPDWLQKSHEELLALADEKGQDDPESVAKFCEHVPRGILHYLKES